MEARDVRTPECSSFFSLFLMNFFQLNGSRTGSHGYGRLNSDTPKIAGASSLESMNVTLYGKRDIVGVVTLRILRWRVYPGLSRWASNVIPRVTEDRYEDRGESKMTTEVGIGLTWSQRIPIATSSWKKQGIDFPMEFPEVLLASGF